MKNLILHPSALLVLFFTSISVYSATNPVNEDSTQLRAATVLKDDILLISATKNGTTTSTIITKYESAFNKYDAQDIYKLFTPETEVADIYTLAEGYALAFNKFNTYPFTAPLGVRTSTIGTVIFSFIGAGGFQDADVFLINAMNGSAQNLKENPNYELTLNGTNNQGVLFVSFRKAGISTNETTIKNDDDIQIYAEVDKIRVKSSPTDLIREIILFNLSGNIIDQYCCFLNTSNYEIPATKNQIYLVQVFTDKKTRMGKILVK